MIEGNEPQSVGEEFTVIPTPGHTAGHCVLHHKQFLFTGDHLWWDRDTRQLEASQRYNWWSWEEQIRSLARLIGIEFEWVLPGHGERVYLPQQEMAAQLQQLVERFR